MGWSLARFTGVDLTRAGIAGIKGLSLVPQAGWATMDPPQLESVAPQITH